MNLFNINITPEQIDHNKAWVGLLRSEAYKQGKKVLRTSADTFCCLGVACDSYDPKGWTDKMNLSHATRWSWRENASSLPVEVMTYYGLQSPCGWFVDANGKKNSLAAMNDNNTSFAEIADVIEAELALVTK